MKFPNGLVVMLNRATIPVGEKEFHLYIGTETGAFSAGCLITRKDAEALVAGMTHTLEQPQEKAK